MTGVTFRVIDSVEQALSLEDQWRELHLSGIYRSIYNGFDFVAAAIGALSGTDVLPQVLVASVNHRVIAIFPFQRSILRRHGLRIRVLEYVGLREIDKPYPLIREGCEALAWRELAAYLKRRRRLWHLLELTEIPDTMSAPAHLKEQFQMPFYRVRVKPDYPTPLVSLTLPWQERWDKHPKMRKKVSRMQRSFGERMRFEVQSGTGGALEAYLRLEQSGWKAGKVGIGKDAETLRFYTDFLGRLAERGQVQFGLLYIDEALVAAEIAYTEGARVYFSHGTYDEAYAKYSPGMVSTCLFLRHFHASGLAEGDYLAGFTDYLAPWADRVLASRHLLVARLSPVVLAMLVGRLYARLVKPTKHRRKPGGWVASAKQ